MSNKEKAVDVKNRGNKAFTSGDLKEAVKLYTEAINLDPTDHTFWANRSASYSGLAQHDKALSDAEEAIRLKKDWMKGYYRKGIALLALENYDEALGCLKKALQLEPSNPDIPKRIEEVEFERKKRREQQAALKGTPNKGYAAEKEAGNEAYKQGKYDQAVNFYTRALQVAKTDEEKATVLANRAAALSQQKFYDRVIKDCTDALALDPQHKWPSSVKALLRRGLAYEDGEKWSLALQDMKLAFQLDPNARQASDAMVRLNRNIALQEKLKKSGK